MSRPWRLYVCRACGYIYDEKLGDPDGGLPPGTRFEDIPDDWVCPLCGVGKRDFELLEAPDRNLSFDVLPTDFASDAGKKGVVVIGAGFAGWSLVDALRTCDPNLPIVLITADSGCRYHKPMLSLAISEQKTPADLIQTSGAKAAKQAQIRLVAHTFVVDIDSENKSVQTTRGVFFYDKLALALGAEPAYPPSIPKSFAWHLNSLRAYDGLLRRLDSPKRVAVVGAGMVGVEFAEALCLAGHRVFLLDKAMYPLAQILPPVAGESVAKALAGVGATFFGGVQVGKTQHGAQGRVLHLQNADESAFEPPFVEVDEIVVATGLVVNARLPARVGARFDARCGIAVDEATLQTSVKDVFAIGDCVAFFGRPCRFIAPLRKQAQAIAQTITGKAHRGYKHESPPIRLKNKAFGLRLEGDPTGDGKWRVRQDTGKALIMEQQDGDRVVATLTLTMPS